MMRTEARNTFGQQAAGQQQQQSHERGAGDWTGYQPQSAVLASIAARQADQASQPALPAAQPAPQAQPGQLQPPPDHPPAMAASAALTPATDASDHAANAAAVAKSRPAARPSYSSKPVLNESVQQQPAAGVTLCPPSLWCYAHTICAVFGVSFRHRSWTSTVGTICACRQRWGSRGEEGAATGLAEAPAGAGHRSSIRSTRGCSCSAPDWRLGGAIERAAGTPEWRTRGSASICPTGSGSPRSA